MRGIYGVTLFICVAKSFYSSYAIYYNEHLCSNGGKAVLHCMHSQSGLCKNVQESQPCITPRRWDAAGARTCSLEYIPSSECANSEWPNFNYAPLQPPFRLLLYQYHTWAVQPILALNLSLAADIPTGITGIRFYFQHQHDPDRRLCRRFSISNVVEVFEDEASADFSDTDFLSAESTFDPHDNDFYQSVGSNQQYLYESNKSLDLLLKKSSSLTSHSPLILTPSSEDDLGHLPSFKQITAFSSGDINSAYIDDGIESLQSTYKQYQRGNSNYFQYQSPVANSLPRSFSKISKRELISSDKTSQSAFFWDCPMFKDGFEGEDFFLRLSDDEEWGAHLSFRVPHLSRHNRYSTHVKDWAVFFYLHMEHVTLELSVPVTFQSAPFPRLLYNVSLWHVSCMEDTKRDKSYPKAAEDKTRYAVSDACKICGSSIASVLVSGFEEVSYLNSSESDSLLIATLPYQTTVGSYLVTVQIVSKDCGASGCYLSRSPVFHVRGRGYGRWLVVAVVVMLLLFLLSFTVMALVIRAQAEVASKKLWCRPRVLLVCSPHSPTAVSMTSALCGFLQHSAALAPTTLHSHLADSDPCRWLQYEMRTANKVLFLVPPRGKALGCCSPVAQQWRLGVLSYAATQGVLASGSSGSVHSLMRRDRDKFALVMLHCSGLVPSELSHMQRFLLPDELVALVTWLHDGTVLERLCLWRPLVTHADVAASLFGGPLNGAESSCGTPYKDSSARDSDTEGGASSKSKRKKWLRTRKKNSLIWSGCRRGAHSAEEGRTDSSPPHCGAEAQNFAPRIVYDGAAEFVFCESCISDGDEPKSLCIDTESKGLESSVNHPDAELRICSKCGNYFTLRDSYHFADYLSRSGRDNFGPGNTSQLHRTEAAGEAVDTGSRSQGAEERVSFPVTQSPFAPTLSHLLELIRALEAEEEVAVLHPVGDVELRATNTTSTNPPKTTTLSTLRKLALRVFAKQNGLINKPILEDAEEFSLYDNSITSAAPAVAVVPPSVCHHVASSTDCELCSCGHLTHCDPVTLRNPELYNHLSVSPTGSMNTLCNISMSNEDAASSDCEQRSRQLHLSRRQAEEERISVTTEELTTSHCVDLTEDRSSLSLSSVHAMCQYDLTAPNVNDLPLLGEELFISPDTESSSCQVEKDDDDFTAMLFGGTVSE